MKWLERGDRNTSYFHAMLLEKIRRNGVSRLRNEGGRWEEIEEGKKGLITNYFLMLFKSSNANGATEQLLNVILP